MKYRRQTPSSLLESGWCYGDNHGGLPDRRRWPGKPSLLNKILLQKRLKCQPVIYVPKHGKRSKGKPRMQLNETYRNDGEIRFNVEGLTVQNMKVMAADKKRWRADTRLRCIIEDDTIDVG